MKEKVKNEYQNSKFQIPTSDHKGITLIALVVTIIVLIILAGVTINTVISDNGILARARGVEKANERGEIIERARLDILDLRTQLYGKEITDEQLDNIIKKYAVDQQIKSDAEGEYIETPKDNKIYEWEIYEIRTSDATNPGTEDPSKPTFQLSGTKGNNDWYKSDVEVTISVAASSTNVESITYEITGAQETEATTGTSVKITEEGTSIITANSYDSSGNKLASNTIEVKKDTQGPIFSGMDDITYECWGGENVTIPYDDVVNGVSVSDDISGIEGTYTCDWEEGIFVGYDKKEVTINFSATDKAGNTMNATRDIIGQLMGCFVAGTKISTEKGLVNIEDIKIGDFVYSYNEETRKVEQSKVINTMIKESNEIMTIEFEKGEAIQNTSEHPYYIIGKGWIKAGDLEIGDKVLTQEGNEYKITNIETKQTNTTKVYNLTVDNNHNYFVGTEKILVHNKVCVFPDSKITVSLEGEYILAKDLKEGNNIAYYDFETESMKIGQVEEVYIHENATDFVTYTFEDGTYLSATNYHPIYTKQGWKSYTQKNGYETPQIGDEVKTQQGWKKITEIRSWTGVEDCYDYKIKSSEGKNVGNYYANDVLVESWF